MITREQKTQEAIQVLQRYGYTIRETAPRAGRIHETAVPRYRDVPARPRSVYEKALQQDWEALADRSAPLPDDMTLEHLTRAFAGFYLAETDLPGYKLVGD